MTLKTSLGTKPHINHKEDQKTVRKTSICKIGKKIKWILSGNVALHAQDLGFNAGRIDWGGEGQTERVEVYRKKEVLYWIIRDKKYILEEYLAIVN